MVAALEPYKCVFWVLQDEIPIWGGPITSWTPTTMLGGLLPFTASTMESMFQYRLITDTFNFNLNDAAAVMRYLGVYAMGKTPNGQIAGMNMAGPHVGITVTQAFNGSYMQSVYDAWNTLVSTYDLQYTITPGFTTQANGTISLSFNMQVGAPLGRTFSESQLSFVYPSKSVFDYQYTRQNSALSNAVIVTGTDSTANANVYTSAYPHGYDLTALNNDKYPLMQSSVSPPLAITNGQSTVNKYADTWVKTTSVQSQITPVISIGPGAFPRIYDISLGDQCIFAATSALHPAQANGSPGIMMYCQITGWTVAPPSQGNPESVTLNLGAVLPVVEET